MILSVTHAMLDVEEYMYHVGGKNQAFFTTSNPVYLFTNDKPLDILNNLDLGGSLLSVTASFDHLLNAILMGCKDIRSFDINRNAKYFAELKIEAIKQLSEDEKRFYQRNRVRKWNYVLKKTALKAGVKNFDRFHNAGYKGLYNGETANDIVKRKKLRYREDILDNMGSDELAANLFRVSLTNQKLINENIRGEKQLSDAHYEVGVAVRNTIEKVGGTLPEYLPTPDKSLKSLEKESKKYKELE